MQLRQKGGPDQGANLVDSAGTAPHGSRIVAGDLRLKIDALEEEAPHRPCRLPYLCGISLQA